MLRQARDPKLEALELKLEEHKQAFFARAKIKEIPVGKMKPLQSGSDILRASWGVRVDKEAQKNK